MPEPHTWPSRCTAPRCNNKAFPQIPGAGILASKYWQGWSLLRPLTLACPGSLSPWSSRGLPSEDRCPNPFSQDTSHTGLGPLLRASFQINYLLQNSISKHNLLPSIGLGCQHMNSEGHSRHCMPHELRVRVRPCRQVGATDSKVGQAHARGSRSEACGTSPSLSVSLAPTHQNSRIVTTGKVDVVKTEKQISTKQTVLRVPAVTSKISTQWPQAR